MRKAPKTISNSASVISRKKSKSIFVVMSFSDNPILESYYNEAIKPCMKKMKFEPVRIDELAFNGKITDEIAESIKSSRAVLVDLTEDKPNCYFEAGFAIALGKEVIFQRLNAPGYEPKMEFDVKDFNHILYTTISDLKVKLKTRLSVL